MPPRRNLLRAMIRSLALLLIGFLGGVVYDKFLPQAVPATPAVIQNVAASLGLKEAPSAAPVALVAPAAYASTGPLSASIQAEKSKDYDEALKQVAAYQQAGGDPFVAAVRAGWLYYLKGAYPEAEQAYANAYRMHSAALNPVLGLLNVAEAMKDPARIQRAAEAVLRIDPANYRAGMLLAGRSYASHDYRGAAFVYRRVLTTYPDDTDARSGAAWADYYTGDTHEALSEFQLILNTYPDYPYAKQGFQLVAGVNGRPSSSR